MGTVEHQRQKQVQWPIELYATANPFLRLAEQAEATLLAVLEDKESSASDVETLLQDSEKNTETTPELQHAILQSCHRSLIHLGDLSRYRESELASKNKKKNWGPAIGYYDLATAIHPSSGVPYNQLAIISRIKGDHALALYQLYRAQSVHEPPATASENLNLEFKKVREAWKRDGLADDTNDPIDSPLIYLKIWFPFLHSCCFGGIASQEYSRLESKGLDQLETGLKERSVDTDFVNRIVISNIAADFAAGDLWEDDPAEGQNEHAFKLFLRLNIRTFSTLLRLLRIEYQQDRNSKSNVAKTDVTNPVVRRLLPSLRYYSSWLISRGALLSICMGDLAMDRFVKEFWAMYTETSSLLLSTAHFEDLPRLEYMLEEDEEIIGFRPLQGGQLEQKYMVPGSSIRKPRCHEDGVKRHPPKVEMLCRIRDFLDDALGLTQNDDVLVHFVQDTSRFVVKDDFSAASQGEVPQSAAEQKSTTTPDRRSRPDAESTTHGSFSPETSVPISWGTTTNQAVGDVTSPEPSNEAEPSPTIPVASNPSARADGGNETSYGVGESTLTAMNTWHQGRLWSMKGQPIQSQSQHSLQSVTSTSSDMPDPTQASGMVKEHRLHPARRKKALTNYQHLGTAIDDFDFNSAVPDSSDAIRQGDALQPTPPNGQG
ncbi:MAG: hypothetical protein Q9166_001202 [cf. Caloplaca sp. 2 TL-2023]